MKLFFKMIIMTFIVSNIQGRELIIIAYKNATSQTLEYVKKYMKEDNLLDLIEFIQRERPCEKKYNEALLHMCITEKEGIHIVGANQEVLKKSFSNLIQKKESTSSP